MQPKITTRLALVMLSFILILLISLTASGIFTTNNFRNPIFINCTLNSNKVQCGDKMIVSVHVLDLYGIDAIEAEFFHENGFDLINLTLNSGSKYCGYWEGNWTVHDTKFKEYKTQVTVFSHSGLSSFINLTWWDPPSWWNTDWAFRKKITLNSSQVPSDQTNFPVLINITDTDLRDKAQSDGDDIAFTDNISNKLNHEMERYTSGTGELIAWVNVTSLSGGSDTEIYMYYGNSGCGSQENQFDVWDSNFIGVWHLDETSGTHYDSTSNNHDSSSVVGVTQDSSGMVEGGDAFDGSNDYIDITMNLPSTVTISVWATYTGSSDMLWCIGSGRPGPDLFFQSNSGIIALNTWDGWNNPFCNGPGSGWHLYSCVIESGNTALYIDGVLGGTANYRNPSDTSFSISSSAGYDWTGLQDEVRISDTARSSDWINTQYNTVNNAIDGGFFSTDSEEVAIPTPPTITSPENNSNTYDITPIFEWEHSEYADNYTLLVDTESDLSDGDEWINISLSSFFNSYTTPSGKALSEDRWYWKVVANNSQGSNSSDVWSFIVDITPPLPVELTSPANNASINENQITFSWNQTFDNKSNSSQVSNIYCYQLQVDDDTDFSSLIINDNTSDNTTYSMTRTVEGNLYWRVRAWDQAGNPGEFSETRELTVIEFSLNPDSTTLQIRRGNIGSINLDINLVFGESENITLNSYWSGDNKPSNIDVNISNIESAIPFNAIISFDCDSSATTGTFTCMINGTSESGIKHSINISITVYSMLFSLDGFPREISMIRSDEATATISVEFDQGALDEVYLTGNWIEGTPTGITVGYSPSSGTPPYDSKITFSTSESAEEGSYVYQIQGEGSGVVKTVNIYINIQTSLSLTVETDKKTYEKGQEINIYGTVKDPEDNPVNSGTAKIVLTSQNWSHTFTTSIKDGEYSTDYYITFDKPDGKWNILLNATDNKGHKTTISVNTSITVKTPEYYDHYSIDILNPIVDQIFKRGETITFTISLSNEKGEKIQGADVKGWLPNGEDIIFSEGSFGIYTGLYNIEYDTQIGDLSLYIEGKRYEEGKLKAGFNYIDFKVQAIKPIIELIGPEKTIIEVGESIDIKIKVLYPDGTPLEMGIITAIVSNDKEIIFSKSGSGVYTAQYTPTIDDIGNFTIQLKIEDAYGNFVELKGENIEVVHTNLVNYLIRYWWATIIGVFSITSVFTYLINKKIRINKLDLMGRKIIELENLKKRNAVMYFSEGKISREVYDHLFQEYETKIAQLSKKHRLLKRKIQKK